MDDLEPSRSRRSYYVWYIGVRWFGGLSAAGMLASDIWRGRWPRVPLGFTSQFALDLALECLAVIVASAVAGVLFGYAMWHFARWFLDVRD